MSIFSRKKSLPTIERSLPQSLRFSATVGIQARQGNAEKLPSFTLVGNTGVPMRLEGFADPVVIDLSGVTVESEKVPLIYRHDDGLRIGHTERVSFDGNEITASGVISSTTEIAQGVVQDARRGFPFQCSIGADIEQALYVDKGDTVTVNGREFEGPLIVAQRTKLKEISICVLGADSQTAFSVAASRGNGVSMNTTDELAAHRLRLANEESRVDRIRAAASRYERQVLNPSALPDGIRTMPELKAFAIGSGMTADEFELYCVRAARPNPSDFFSGGGHHHSGIIEDRSVLECSLMLHVGGKAEKHYQPQTIEAARRLGVRHIMDVVRATVESRSNSYVRTGTRNSEALLQAAFSTADIPDILSGVANKMALDAYQAFPSAARLIAKRLNANDFKDHTGVRLTGGGEMLEVGADGAIKHGVLTDQSFTYSVSTFARMIGMNRQQIRNDDTGVLSRDVPLLLGRGAALALEKAFWTLVIANTGNFFHTDNKNLLTGGGSVLSAASLQNAVKLFLEQTDPDGSPISVVPHYLCVPPALKGGADELYVSRTLNVGGGSESTDNRLPGENILFGKYEPVVSPWIGANGLPNGTDTQFYLFGKADDVAAFGIAYLDGVENPTIEQVDPPSDMLGIQLRGYFDFGVCQVDHRGAVKSNGA